MQRTGAGTVSESLRNRVKTQKGDQMVLYRAACKLAICQSTAVHRRLTSHVEQQPHSAQLEAIVASGSLLQVGGAAGTTTLEPTPADS
jgi:hypothetical protein